MIQSPIKLCHKLRERSSLNNPKDTNARRPKVVLGHKCVRVCVCVTVFSILRWKCRSNDWTQPQSEKNNRVWHTQQTDSVYVLSHFSSSILECFVPSPSLLFVFLPLPLPLPLPISLSELIFVVIFSSGSNVSLIRLFERYEPNSIQRPIKLKKRKKRINCWRKVSRPDAQLKIGAGWAANKEYVQLTFVLQFDSIRVDFHRFTSTGPSVVEMSKSIDIHSWRPW